jgi:hypothetical protein
MIIMATSTEIRHVYHEDGTEDTRYSVKWEYTGRENPWAVARFEGHWIGESGTEEFAWFLARHHAEMGRE